MVLVKCRSCGNIWDFRGESQYATCWKCHNKINVKKNQVIPVFFGYHLAEKEGVWNVIRDGEVWKLVSKEDGEEISFESQQEFVKYFMDYLEELYEFLRIPPEIVAGLEG